MIDEIDPKIDAFEPQNRFIIATGPLTCMPPAGNRSYFVTKSPLTGGIANAGGWADILVSNILILGDSAVDKGASAKYI